MLRSISVYQFRLFTSGGLKLVRNGKAAQSGDSARRSVDTKTTSKSVKASQTGKHSNQTPVADNPETKPRRSSFKDRF